MDTSTPATCLGHESVETHISTIYFDGDLAYKVKKPLKTPFLDFSTPALRRRACELEVGLNQRLAPDVYLGVEDVVVADGALEPAVVMRRMPAHRRLAHLVSTGHDVRAELRSIARTMAIFHQRARTGPGVERAGLPEAVRARWVANIDEMQAFVPSVFLRSELDQLSDRVLPYLAGRSELFAARIREGRIRDGHGDLLADDIFCLDDGPRILDCLEFDERLRWMDVLEDAASLAMDLERLGHPDLAAAFLADHAEFLGDRSPQSLAEFYLAYRSVVRAKVAAIRWTQGTQAALGQARGLLRMALEHLERATVRLVLVGGLPGSGKSTVAGALADRHGWCLLRSDVVRRELCGEGAALAGYRQGRYATEVTERTYAELLHRSEMMLALGETVLLDASWSSRARREEAARVAAGASAQLVEIELALPSHQAAARLRQRAGTTDASEATPEVVVHMAADAQAWPSAARLDAAQPPAAVLKMAEAVLSHAR